MATDPKLEAYLSKMERVLAPFPASDRAEILLEIKSHVQSALERDPQTPTDSVLSALGEPELVANRYLLERGLKPTKPPRGPIVKWLVIGFLGTMGMLLLFSIVVISRFSPVLKIDGEKGKISILGGTLEIDGDAGTVRIGGATLQGDDDEGKTIQGSWTPKKGETGFKMKFTNGRVHLKNAKGTTLRWECRGRFTDDDPRPVAKEGTASFDLSMARGIKCQLSVPEHLNLVLEGTNGKIEVSEPHYNLDATLTNGRVSLSPDHGKPYRYSLSVTRGRVGNFDSSPDPKAYQMSVRLTNGEIDRG